MAFVVRWNNPNAVATVVNIYRDANALNPAALPAPIATLSNGETEWRDTTAVAGNTYWYLLTVTANGKTVVGASQKYTISVKRGIGPSTFVSGDDRLGFMGAVPYEELWTPGQMPAGFQAAFPTALTDRPALNKFSRNGKILYMLSNTAQLPGFVSWATLYQAGLVFGRDDTGPAGANGDLAATMQDAKIVHMGDTYRMRLARGLVTDSASVVLPFDNSFHLKDHDAIPELTNACEFNDLIYTMVGEVPVKQRWPNWAGGSYTLIGYHSYNAANPQFNGGTLCQERDTETARVLHRGLFTSGGLTAATQPVSMMQRVNYVLPAQVGRYVPIFELVE